MLSDVFVPSCLLVFDTTGPLHFVLEEVLRSSLFIFSAPRDVSATLYAVLLILLAYLSLFKVFLVGLTMPFVDFLPFVVTLDKVKLCGVGSYVGVDGTSKLLG